MQFGRALYANRPLVFVFLVVLVFLEGFKLASFLAAFILKCFSFWVFRVFPFGGFLVFLVYLALRFILT
jgi:hypothetical protein